QDCYDGCSQPFGSSAFWACCNACGYRANRVVVDHGDGTWSQYVHLDYASVSVGQHVNQADVIGYSGTSGCSSGPHLHYAVEQSCNDRTYGNCWSVPSSFAEAGSPGCGAWVTSQNTGGGGDGGSNGPPPAPSLVRNPDGSALVVAVASDGH